VKNRKLLLALRKRDGQQNNLHEGKGQAVLGKNRYTAKKLFNGTQKERTRDLPGMSEAHG